MRTQRDHDIAELESKLKVGKLFDDWRASYLGERAKVQNASNTGRTQDRGAAESVDQEGAEAARGY